MFTKVKTDAELKNMRASGKMLALVLSKVSQVAVPGISEKELADIAAAELKALGGNAPFLGYNGFPNVICISVNDAVVHGIPSDYVLKDGDIASFDFGVEFSGMITDSAITIPIGNVATKKLQLISVTEQSLHAGIAALKDGVKTGTIGAAVESVLNAHGYGIVRELVGHGVGHHLHEGPDIPNYGTAGTGDMLKKGMTIAIEPMSTLGSERIFVEEDGWTIRTADSSPSAHFEHTILITDDGAEILTIV